MATCGICAEPFEVAPGSAGKICPACAALRRKMTAASAPAVAPVQRPTVAPVQRPTVAPVQRPAAAPVQRAAAAPVQRPAAAPAQRPAAAPAQRAAPARAAAPRHAPAPAPVAPRGKTTRVLATDPDEPETHYVPHAAKQEGLEPAHKIGLAIAGALAIIVCIVIVYVKNTKTAEMQAIQERQRAREALITELKGINLNAVGEPERLLRVVAEKETVWKGTSIAPDILSFKAKAQGALDLAKELADVTKRLEEVERDVKDPATPPAKLGDDRRKIEDLANRGSAFGDEFAKRVSVVRAQIDRVFLQRLAEEARSSPTGDLAASRVALQRFAAAEDEAKRLLDVSINLKDTEGEAHFKELYKTLVGESDRLATAAYTAEVVSQAKPRDMLSGEAATQWNPSPCKGFRAVVENGVLTIVGPDADAGKMGLVSIGDREQWRSFVAEVEFTIESGSFDFFLHLGRSANPSTVQLGIRTSGVESNVPLGKPVRAMFSMIGSKLRFRIIGEGTAEPFEKDMSWTSTRKGAIGILVPDGTRVRFTKFTVKDLR